MRGRDETGDSQKHTETSENTRAKSRKNRVYLFREFLINTYGLAYLQGGVVLDVAGGKGDLSWLLSNVDGISSVVENPRPTDHRHLHKSVAYLRARPDEAELRAMEDRPTHQPLAKLVNQVLEPHRDPFHLRILVNQQLVDAVRDYRATADKAAWCRFYQQALAQGLDSIPPGHPKDSVNDQQILRADQSLDAINNTRLVVGFHPDQATDACADLAQVLGVPFCIVPCCVFPKEFPHRRVHGEKVRDYRGLIEYLRMRHPNSRPHRLPFFDTTTSRNLVLYTLPGD